jgi:hypothetical protein
MVGAACAEWHLHAWDLAAALGKDYQPASPELLAAGWQAFMPHLRLEVVVPVAPCVAVAHVPVGCVSGAGGRPPAPPGSWEAMLCATGRAPR